MMAGERDTELRGMYSAHMAARVARVPSQRFQAWMKSRLLRPYRFEYGKRVENTYSYDDLLLIRLILRLQEQGATAKSIRVALDTIEYMSDGDKRAWQKVTMLVSEGMVAVIFPGKEWAEWNPIAASKGAQKMATVFFPDLVRELQDELVPPDRFKHIEVAPDVLGGSPTVKGTRISTSAVMSVLESGGDPTEVYPGLTDEQVAEALDYERSYLRAA